MNEKLRSALFFAVMLVLSGCSTYSYSSVSTPDGATKASYEPTKAEAIQITPFDIKDKKYEVIGDINAQANKPTAFHDDPTKADVNKELQEKAAEIGADAVIFVRYGEVGVGLMSWGVLEGKGRAIKFTD